MTLLCHRGSPRGSQAVTKTPTVPGISLSLFVGFPMSGPLILMDKYHALAVLLLGIVGGSNLSRLVSD
jgi:hypothetical protein